MKNDYLKYLTYALLLFAIFTACEKDIEIELNAKPDQLVMYAFIYPDSALNIHFSKSQSILSVPDYAQVQNAKFSLSLNGVSQGRFILPYDTVWSQWDEFNFKAGDQIEIEAYEVNGDTLSVESYFPLPVPITNKDTSRIYKNISEGVQEEYLKTKLSFSDPAEEDNYYQLYLVREGWGQIGTDPYYTREIIEYKKDDPVFHQKDQGGSLLQGLDFQGLFSDQLINGYAYTITFNIPADYFYFDYYEDKIKVSMYLYHHTEDYYSYFRSKILSAGYDGFYEGLPIFDPVRIHDNVSGGFGLVSGMSFDVDSLVLVK